jgi:hypothetical protein
MNLIKLVKNCTIENKQTNSVSSVRERTIPTERTPLVGQLLQIECRVDSATDHHGRNLNFLDRSRYFSFQAAPQLYSRG